MLGQLSIVVYLAYRPYLIIKSPLLVMIKRQFSTQSLSRSGKEMFKIGFNQITVELVYNTHQWDFASVEFINNRCKVKLGHGLIIC